MSPNSARLPITVEKRCGIKVVDVLSPLYFARVASFVNRTRHLSNADAEAVIEEQAQVIELRKPYLVHLWSTCGQPPPESQV